MKRLSLIIILLITILCLSSSCEKKNLQRTSSTANVIDLVIHTPLCDSIYQGKFNDYIDNRNDTIINGVKYAYTMILSEKKILAFREYSEEYGMLKHIEILINGVPSKLYDDPDYEDCFYYDTMTDSPSHRYVFFCMYYETMDIKDEEKMILRFRSGYIFDVEKAEIVYSLSSSEVSGYWTFCNQWVVNGKVIFDPADNLE